MPGKGTPQVTLRLPPDLWEEFGRAAERAGVDRSTLLREFIRWYAKQPGASLPKRP